MNIFAFNKSVLLNFFIILVCFLDYYFMKNEERKILKQFEIVLILRVKTIN